jgi:hypothetical protein
MALDALYAIRESVRVAVGGPTRLARCILPDQRIEGLGP